MKTKTRVIKNHKQKKQLSSAQPPEKHTQSVTTPIVWVATLRRVAPKRDPLSNDYFVRRRNHDHRPQGHRFWRLDSIRASTYLYEECTLPRNTPRIHGWCITPIWGKKRIIYWAKLDWRLFVILLHCEFSENNLFLSSQTSLDTKWANQRDNDPAFDI